MKTKPFKMVAWTGFINDENLAFCKSCKERNSHGCLELSKFKTTAKRLGNFNDVRKVEIREVKK